MLVYENKKVFSSARLSEGGGATADVCADIYVGSMMY